MTIGYYYSKAMKKLRGRALLNCVIHPTSKIEAGSEVTNTTFGRHSFCGYQCEINNAEIGSFCSIANGVVIGGGVHPMDWVSTSPVFYIGRDSVKKKYSEHSRSPPLRTVIGHDVWIGSRALIRQGVTIGTGAVIGMGAVVTKNVEPYSVVAGVPARHLHFRFDPQIVAKLLATCWWERDDVELERAAVHIRSPEDFIKELDR